ncbi:MAG: acyltransferase, partial [Myxococcales bacterium]|nr:acyltransferase [Myxococcales bacterium]
MAGTAAPSSHRRLPSLDGLRAISIALVIFSHLLGTRGFPLGERAMGSTGDVGYLGVRVFFVISGFLITNLLLGEHERTGTVSLRGFYIRRAFRIFPAFYAFVAAMVIAGLLGGIEVHRSDVLHAVTYTTNYHYVDRSWELGHMWSLSIEEQFYLLWPALFLVAGPRHIGKVALAMIALAPVLRVVAWFTMPYRDDVIMEAYPCVMDSIAAGSLMAALRLRLDDSARYQRFLRSPLFWLVPVIVVLANLPGRVALNYTVDITVQNLGIALCVDRFVRVTAGPIHRFLNLRWLAYVGTLSYSIYLWQEPFLNHRAHTSFTAWPINLTLALVCAVTSYYLVERPFFALRDAWAAR